MRRLVKMKFAYLFAALIGFSICAQAATHSLTNQDALGESSFNSGSNWDDGLAPSAGNDYVVALEWLRTPPTSDTYYEFAGDSLTLTNGGGMIFKSERSTHYIENLIMVDACRIWGGNEGGGSGTILDGNLTVLMPSTNSPSIHANQSSYDLNSNITGTGDLTLAGDYSITLNGTNDMSGDIIVAAGTKTFNTNSLSIFTIGADGQNNAITGTGAVFDGHFEFDLTGASVVLGDSWAVATAGASFGDTFTVDGFSDNGDGTWFLDNGSAKYKFYESTGLLEVVSNNVIPIVATDLTPADDGYIFDPQPEISITLVDGNFDTVETGTIAMSVAGSSVTPSVTSPGSGTNVVSYTPASNLSGGDVAVVVTYDDDKANSFTNSWSFYVHPTTTEKLWNINIAGNGGGTYRPVEDGVIAMAPSAGLNLWNNIQGYNSQLNVFPSITDASGANAIQISTDGSHNWGESTTLVFPDMFYGWTGANAPMNMTATLSNLDPDDAYDIYLYSTWRWTQLPVNYEIVQGYADVTEGTITEVQANVLGAVSNDYSGCVYGENYIVFTNVTPTLAGEITFAGQSDDGVLCGLQVLEVPGAASRPALDVAGSDPVDGAVLVSATPTLTAYFIDITETIDTGSIDMTVDGAAVSPTFTPGSPTSAVSYVIATPFEPLSTHTAKVVLASTPSGILYTNEWSFKVTPEAGSRTYVDATTANTLAWDGAAYSVWAPTAGDFSGNHPDWGYRAFGNGAEIYQSSFTNDSSRLKTTVSGLPAGSYDVYAYMWVQGNEWRIQASLTDNVGGDLPQFNQSDYATNQDMMMPWADYGGNTYGDWSGASPSPYLNSDLAVSLFDATTVMVAEADRRLMEVYLGRVTGTEISVYIDDDPSTETAERTWYDGISYQEYTGGATTDPDIESIVVSDGIVTLTWASDSFGTYSILRATDLVAPIWTPVKPGIPGGDPTTTDSVPVGTAAAEFYKIEGN